jgi:hypothetical protein
VSACPDGAPSILRTGGQRHRRAAYRPKPPPGATIGHRPPVVLRYYDYDCSINSAKKSFTPPHTLFSRRDDGIARTTPHARKLNMVPASTIVTFRCWTEEDSDLAFSLWGDPRVDPNGTRETAIARLHSEMQHEHDFKVQCWATFVCDSRS